MEWQQLEYFRAVAAREHVTRAAEDLSVSQSAVSRAIANLEEELGVTLFDRRGRAVVLNRYGKLFLRRVQRAHEEIDEGRRELADATGSQRGIVALGFLHSLGVELVPRLIREFRVTHPDVRFQLIQNSGEFVMEHLHAGEVDLAISVPGLFERGSETWATLTNEELFATVPRDHPLAAKTAIRLEELRPYPFVMLKLNHTMRVIVEGLCRSAGFTPKIAFEGDDAETVRGLVAAGLGVTLLSAARTPRDDIHLIPVHPKPVRTLGLGWLDDRYMSPITRQFRDFVLERARDDV